AQVTLNVAKAHAAPYVWSFGTSTRVHPAAAKARRTASGSGPRRTRRPGIPWARGRRSTTADAVPGRGPASYTAAVPALRGAGTCAISAGSGPPGSFALVATRGTAIAGKAAGMRGARSPTAPGASPAAAAYRPVGSGTRHVAGPGRSARAAAAMA